MDTLNFITCGSVDDSKSTLIGRLLFESRSIFDDQLTALEKDSHQHGTQGITIDVAYRFLPLGSGVFGWPTRLAMNSTLAIWPPGRAGANPSS